MTTGQGRPRFAPLLVAWRGLTGLWAALRERRLLWLLPLVAVLLLIAVLLAVLASAGPLAPFLYPLL